MLIHSPRISCCSGLTVNELHDLEIRCRNSEYRIVQPPNGESCEAWLGPFIASGGGYVNNPGASSDCQCTCFPSAPNV